MQLCKAEIYIRPAFSYFTPLMHNTDMGKEHLFPQLVKICKPIAVLLMHWNPCVRLLHQSHLAGQLLVSLHTTPRQLFPNLLEFLSRRGHLLKAAGLGFLPLGTRPLPLIGPGCQSCRDLLIQAHICIAPSQIIL